MRTKYGLIYLGRYVKLVMLLPSSACLPFANLKPTSLHCVSVQPEAAHHSGAHQ